MKKILRSKYFTLNSPKIAAIFLPTILMKKNPDFRKWNISNTQQILTHIYNPQKPQYIVNNNNTKTTSEKSEKILNKRENNFEQEQE